MQTQLLSSAPGLAPARANLGGWGWVRANPLVVGVVVGCIALVAVAGLGLLLDPRTIVGAPAWAKPFKFAVSIAWYCATLAWLLSYVRGRRWVAGAIGGITALSLATELVIILVQVIRGRASHFNHTTPLDETLWSMMGMLIMPVALLCLLTGVLLLFQRLPNAAFAWSLRLGVLITFLGMCSGFLMTGQRSPAQRAGDAPGMVGAHSVGVEDGGPGLPLLGWSTEAGDLRVGHFVGLHALQVLPLVGLAVSRLRVRGLGQGHRAALVWLAGAGYLGLMALLVWQALRGQPVVAPDALTLAALAALGVGVGLGVGSVFLAARSKISA